MTLLLTQDGILAPLWLLGALCLGHERRWLPALVFGGLAALGLAALAGRGPGVEPGVQWGAVALLALRRGAPPGSELARALPLGLVVLGPTAAVAGVVLTTTGALAGPRRVALAGGLAALVAAGLWDAHSLSLWLLLMRWLGIGMDPASALVDGGEQALRALGWLGLGRWVAR